MKQEICRIVSGYDIEAEENRWWEARLITTEGEQVIDRVDYIDERYRDRGFLYNFFFSFLPTLAPSTQYEREQLEAVRTSQDLSANARARLISRLIAEDWEPTSTDSDGHIVRMRRRVG